MKTYMGITPIYRRRNLYLALEGLDFTFDEADIPDIKRMWEEGLSIWDIARAYERDPDEITVLIMDLARKAVIEPRQGGAKGRRRLEPSEEKER